MSSKMRFTLVTIVGALAVCLSSLYLAKSPATAIEANDACSVSASNQRIIDCKLQEREVPTLRKQELQASGVQINGIVPETSPTLRFTNTTDHDIHISKIIGETDEHQFWSEFCVYLNDYFTGQKKPGVGNVGCSLKNPGEAYRPLQWGAPKFGLTLAPGDVLLIGTHTEPHRVTHRFSITVSSVPEGLKIYRSPAVDKVFNCDGDTQSEAWNPLRNDSGHVQHLVGATIYAISGDARRPNEVDRACFYILDDKKAIKYRHCDAAVGTLGKVYIPPQDIQPGEYVLSQAINSCAAPRHWGWAAYMYIVDK